MKKLLINIVILALVSFIASVSINKTLAAPTSSVSGEPTATENLIIENPGILPTNPFYFLKELGRNVNRLFTFNSISRAELELNIANQKAAELKKVEELKPGDIEAIKKAADNYADSIKRLNSRAGAIKENSENSRVDKLLNQVANKTLEHGQLFRDINNKYQELRKQTEDIQGQLGQTVIEISENLDNPEKFKERLKEAIKNQTGSGKELGNIDFISRLEGGAVSAEMRGKLSELKSDEFLKLEEEIKKQLLDAAGDSSEADKFLRGILPSNSLDQLKILNEIKERPADSGLKPFIKRFQKSLLEKIEMNNEVSAEKAAGMIKSAEDTISKVEAELAEVAATNQTAVSPNIKSENQLISAKTLLEQAKLNLAKAEWFYDGKNYGAAYGQADSAAIIAKNALGQLLKRSDDIQLNEKQIFPGNTVLSGKPVLPEKPVLSVPPFNKEPVKPNPVGSEPRFCTQEYAPVCGVDGKTYSNSCVAEQISKVKIQHEGECKNTKVGE